MPTLLAGKLKSSGTAFMFGVAGASDENSLNPISRSGLKRIGEGQQIRILRDETLGFRAYRAFLSLSVTYSLHCSSFFWFNQFYIKDPKR